ncbi:MAG: flagellar motor switch protein FliG [Gammaproteobacteria bacterium]|nr:flagellar motor switch protein FliG [Gammaproteobacteria bacterium]
MKSEIASLTGTDRAAVLLMTLGEEAASQVLKHLRPKEVQTIGTAMTNLPSVTRAQLEAVMEEFSTTVEEQTAIGLGSEDYVRKVLVQALGEDRARSLIDRILVGGQSKGLESLKWMDGRSVADMIRNEHPQIIAIVVSYLDSDHAAEVLSYFPQRLRSDVVMRIATLDTIHPNALQELDEILERQFAGDSSKASVVGGLKRAADILNYMDMASETAILDEIREHDPNLSVQIQELMFTFENLLEIDDRSMQRILRELPRELLVVALKGATAEIKQHFFRNLSKGAREALEEDLELRGPVRVSEMESAQKEILSIVRRLADEGEIAITGRGEEYV